MQRSHLQLGIDSQIEFSIKPFIGATSVLAELRVEAECRDETLAPKLHLDYGAGFDEAVAVKMVPNGPKTWVAYIPTPQILRRARLDLIEISANVVLHAIVVQRAALTQAVGRLLTGKANYWNTAARSKVEHGLAHLAHALPRIAQGDEGLNHTLLAEAIAAGFNHVSTESPLQDNAYLAWIARHETLTPDDRTWMEARTAAFLFRPVLSVLMPVYEPPLDLLDEAIASLQRQTYPYWELCIADDASPSEAVRDLIRRRAAEDPRIKPVFRAENGHISRTTNSAAALATGAFLILMDNDDVIPDHALFTVAHAIDAHPGVRMLFSDEDKISINGFRCEPYLKGAFDRFLLYGHNMFSHLGIYQRKLFDEVGGFRPGYEGSQDYDLTLRCMERCTEAEIVHIPHVLYHWRQIPGSTSMGAGEKSYAFEAAKRAIDDHFVRMGYPLRSINADVPGVAAVRTLSQPRAATISIVIPTRDGLDLLKPCIASLLTHPDPLTDIVIVDNGSKRQETLTFLDGLSQDANRFTVVRDEGDFNFSRLVNIGVSKARGEIVCLLNNDTELLSANLYERARAWLSMPDVGIVGARLLYPDRTLQHFGVYVGIGEHRVADHAYLGSPDHLHAYFSKSRLLQQFSAVTAACLFVRRDDYLAVGGFDEELAVAFNDVDFCLKVRLSGLKIICDPDIKLIHKESKSRGQDKTPPKRARLDVEAAIVRERWEGTALDDPFYNPRFSRQNPRFEQTETSRQLLPWKNAYGKGL
ncbi:glycosyltransferase family 2 protein [Methylobacterium sp. J-059]|uniref:glycosyltransferase family 2 protein n=1 Tax=Methylobacterium sp. J-059 TaxID=2836643 RepID=UPI001FB9BF81|nr:glycosyltransferase family 2 protein [Methylobacterium sp. J-059]MCJ2042710.1 glycosyltransferase family 2 protein [Methylobacterium sp. J-059]